MPTQKKSIFDKAIDALTDRDEKAAAAAKAAADAKLAADNAARANAAKAAAAKTAMDKAAADKAAAAAKAAADKAAADKMIAAQQEAMKKMAAAGGVAAAAARKGTVTARSLHIRKDHSTTSAEVGGLIKGNEVTILETWTDGTNTWARLGPDQWAAIVYKGETYIQVS